MGLGLAVREPIPQSAECNQHLTTMLADRVIEQNNRSKAEPIILGIDVHADKQVVVRQIDGQTPQPTQRFSKEGMLRWAKEQRSLAREVHSCYEAGPIGYGLHRFSDRRQVANYTGLCPREDSSGNRRLQGSVTKHRNPRLRRPLVETTWRLLRFQPNYRRLDNWWAEQPKGKGKAPSARKKKMVMAIARQVMIMISGGSTPR
jgi:hypothetical protein